MVLDTDSAAHAALPSKPQARRVLIVDDHPIYRDGLRELLEDDLGFELVGEAESEDDAFRQFTTAKADFVTVDVTLGAGNGLSLIARIKESVPSTTILAISMFQDKVYADLALAAGASGYLCKHSPTSEAKNAVNTVLNGGVYYDPTLRRQGVGSHLDTSPGALSDKRLSSRELQIFTMIGQGRNTHDIATDLHIAVSTVETYRERLKTKLNLSSGTELIRHAMFWHMQKKA